MLGIDETWFDRPVVAARRGARRGSDPVAAHRLVGDRVRSDADADLDTTMHDLAWSGPSGAGELDSKPRPPPRAAHTIWWTPAQP